jgi:hypothetical protein
LYNLHGDDEDIMEQHEYADYDNEEFEFEPIVVSTQFQDEKQGQPDKRFQPQQHPRQQPQPPSETLQFATADPLSSVDVILQPLLALNDRQFIDMKFSSPQPNIQPTQSPVPQAPSPEDDFPFSVIEDVRAILASYVMICCFIGSSRAKDNGIVTINTHHCAIELCTNAKSEL